MKKIVKNSMGCGDRFGMQGKAQLSAFLEAEKYGCEVSPVWNKSFREHSIIGTEPGDVRSEADSAVQALGWTSDYYVDADHIGLKNVDGFIDASDFFTLDVAESIGAPAGEADVGAFVRKHESLCGSIDLPDYDGEVVVVSPDRLADIARTYIAAIKEAGRIYRRIAARKSGAFVVEVSMDEAETPQTPEELLFILAGLADENIPVQTIAPKFCGRFNKGVEYVGDPSAFEAEFDADAAVTQLAMRQFGLPETLKLSVHSGSDKFGIYSGMRRVLKKRGLGLHLKTAGTTWLEEVAGLAAHGGRGLDIARRIYSEAYGRLDELCGPYATVIDIDPTKLASPDVVNAWSGDKFLQALRHKQSDPSYNADMRQLVHVGYKVAAEMGDEYLDAVAEAEASVSSFVCENLLKNHILPIFG